MEALFLRFIFLIDEWDCVMRERQESEALQKQYLDFLRDLLKDQPYVALAYVTGILPVKKYGQHSALNMFREFSMTDQKDLEEYTGFTEDEVRALCRRYDMSFAETGSWYDGYRFTKFQHVYNPRSVVEAMLCRKYSSYWTSTETYEALKIYMDMDFDGLRSDIVRMLGGGRVKVNTLSFQNDMRNFKIKDDILTLLIHLGYLGYDFRTEEAFIPNKEITREFENAMSVGGWSNVIVFLPLPHTGKPALVVELKYGRSAGAAIRQIKDRQYTQALEDYAGEILLVGINYDRNNKNKPHSCEIEKIIK